MAVDYDLVIIGGGSAGLVVASIAAQLKAKVALVERDRLGGDCLWFGCVPSKSLVHASRLAHDMRHADRLGISCKDLQIDFSKAIAHVERVIAAIQPHDSPERFEGLGVEVISGEGAFASPHVFAVNDRSLAARSFVIATGSRPAVPDIPGLAGAGFMTNEQVFSLTACPATLVVIGAGPIGCELGQALSRLGAQVTILASGDRILPKEDPDVAAVVTAQFEAEGIRVLTGARAERVELQGNTKFVFARGERIACEQILLAVGRVPNSDRLNLANAGVEFDRQGIKVNAKLQTSNPRIYACGDVIGKYQFTHVAGYEAVVVAKNALFFPLSRINYHVIPWATFTDPEVARVGLSEAEAHQTYKDIAVLKQDYAGVDRAQATAATQGFAKFICRSNGEIVGAHLVGASAGELIHEVVLAMAHKLKVSALTGIHIYPTLAELNSKAALLLSKRKFADNQTLKQVLENFFRLRRRFR
ncbi:dihydrolipoyl dehydrogenase family protein [Pseudanabaena sp. PCC 6802]|uniref:dihydrolipoyl dehydrogenase family protein n=1 Tax=Pseudanabaena sp. PCC 6802 TaxID=118173 RepID=UPI00034CB35E|nr:mercuric reductase [Pseudanabaena sp. PCC 6802]